MLTFLIIYSTGSSEDEYTTKLRQFTKKIQGKDFKIFIE